MLGNRRIRIRSGASVADTERSRARLRALHPPGAGSGWVPGGVPPTHTGLHRARHRGGGAPQMSRPAETDERFWPATDADAETDGGERPWPATDADLGRHDEEPSWPDPATTVRVTRLPTPEPVEETERGDPVGRHRTAAVSSPSVLSRLAGLLPASWQLARLDPRRRGVLAVAAVLVLAVAVTAFVVWRDRPTSRPLSPADATAPSVSVAGAPATTVDTGPTAGASSAAGVVVDVTGRVRKPGLVHLAAGSRVDDAVRAAGGALPRTNLADLNLARRLLDGEQIVVGAAAQPAASASTAGSDTSAGSSGTGSVDLNTATESDLDGLPGVGPVLAQHILDYRTQHNGFRSVDQLREVDGIGDARFADLQPLVTV